MATVATDRHIERVEREGSGAGWIVAIIALIAIVLLFLFAGTYFRSTGTNVNLPSNPDTTNNTTPQINGGSVDGSASGNINGSVTY